MPRTAPGCRETLWHAKSRHATPCRAGELEFDPGRPPCLPFHTARCRRRGRLPFHTARRGTAHGRRRCPRGTPRCRGAGNRSPTTAGPPVPPPARRRRGDPRRPPLSPGPAGAAEGSWRKKPRRGPAWHGDAGGPRCRRCWGLPGRCRCAVGRRGCKTARGRGGDWLGVRLPRVNHSSGPGTAPAPAPGPRRAPAPRALARPTGAGTLPEGAGLSSGARLTLGRSAAPAHDHGVRGQKGSQPCHGLCRGCWRCRPAKGHGDPRVALPWVPGRALQHRGAAGGA